MGGKGAKAMSPKSLFALAGLALLAVGGAAAPACVQPDITSPGQGPSFSLPEHRPRIQVRPQRLLYRRCTVEYEIQNRPSGTVLYPAQHCWWVRG
jgi:hypothetical protein